MTCPRCESDEWKLASLIHAEGTLKTESFSAGGGGLFGEGNATPIVTSGVSFGQQQSSLAKIAAPPERDRFRPPKAETPIANVHGKKGVLIISVGIAGMILSDHIQSLLWVFLVIITLLTGVFYLLKALAASLFGSEATKNKMARLEAKARWQADQERKMKSYEATRICMRCGHKYLPD
jgi:hypothetical protein